MHFPSLALPTTLFPSIHAPPIPSHGCGTPLPYGLIPGGPSVNFTLYSPHGGGERRYLLHLPDSFSAANAEPAPMVVVIHAFTQTTGSMEVVTGFSERERKGGYVAVYPEGVNVGCFLSLNLHISRFFGFVFSYMVVLICISSIIVVVELLDSFSYYIYLFLNFDHSFSFGNAVSPLAPISRPLVPHLANPQLFLYLTPMEY